jgi:hypothetical protein
LKLANAADKSSDRDTGVLAVEQCRGGGITGVRLLMLLRMLLAVAVLLAREVRMAPELSPLEQEVREQWVSEPGLEEEETSVRGEMMISA